METAINLLHRHLRMAIVHGTADPHMFGLVLSALAYFDPFQVPTIRELCFYWITDILSSRYAAGERCRLAGKAVELAWEQVKPMISKTGTFYGVKAAWVPPLLDFLQLSEEFYSVECQSAPGALALQILSASQGYDGFGPKLLPTLASTLLPAHPLSSRESALKVFHRFIPGWFSQMESVSNADRAGLLQAVGDPFQSAPDTPLQDKEHVFTNEYEPMRVAIVLIEFASSGLWREHLRPSNFASCEGVASTVDGKKSVFDYMQRAADGFWPQFLCTPAKIITAIERLEELQCPNTAEVVLMWAWTFGVVDAVDHDTWRLIERKTLAFYQTHKNGRLNILPRHIVDDNALRVHRRDPWCRVEGVRSRVRIAKGVRRLDPGEGYFTDLPLARVCQLRRLYQLFGCDPTTWGMVAVEKEEEEMDVSFGRSLHPVHSIECV